MYSMLYLLALCGIKGGAMGSHVHGCMCTCTDPSNTCTTAHDRVVGDFVQKVSSVEEQHAQQLNSLVRNFRRKTQDNFRKDP